jgi:ABC-type multidrug transport system fused ATPase/permease subunit
LNGFNLKVESGKVYAFVGESGCGKTTTFSLLQRFYDVVDGAILVDGINVKNIDLHYLRTHITTVSQEPSLFDATIAENIAYGKENATREEIVQAAKRANAHDFIMKFDKGYDTSVGECGSMQHCNEVVTNGRKTICRSKAKNCNCKSAITRSKNSTAR